MRPLERQKAEGRRLEEYLELGIPEEWVSVLQKLGYSTIEKLKEVEKHTKLHQEMMGYRKKNKLEIGTVTPDEVKEWLSAKSEQDKTREKQYPSLDPTLYNRILKNYSKRISQHYSRDFEHIILNYLNDPNLNQKLFEEIFKFLVEPTKYKKQIK